jgi:hypothetical protein
MLFEQSLVQLKEKTKKWWEDQQVIYFECVGNEVVEDYISWVHYPHVANIVGKLQL